MENKQIKYVDHSAQLITTGESLTALATGLIQANNLKEETQWFMALAVCKAALAKSAVDETIKELLSEMSKESHRDHSSFYLNEEDYANWFADVVTVNVAFAALNWTKSYVNLHELYLNARFGYKDEEKAIAYIKEGYAKGDKTSQAFVGYNTYYGSLGFEQDKEEGLRLITTSFDEENEVGELFALNIEFRACESAEEGETVLEKYNDLIHNKKRGIYVLADYYLREEDNVKALETLKFGIANNSGYCSYLLGLMIINQRFAEFGFTVEEGRAHLEEGFSHGISYAGFLIGYSYLYPNDGSEPQFEQAIHHLSRAAIYNAPEAELELAMLYLYHQDYRDLAKGMELLDRGIAAKYHKAMTEKAYTMLDFDLVERNVPAAKALLEEAMEMGNDYAPYRLGLGYQDAEWEDEANLAKALELFELAAERNHNSGTEYAGKYYRYGYVGEPDYAKAMEYYDKAIEYFNSGYAKVEKAMMLEAGEGVEVNHEEARDLYLSALEYGYTYAALRLAFMYEEDVLGEPDLAVARQYFEQAAEAEIPAGVYHTARFYRYGIGGEADEVKAFELFEKALELGFVDANVDIALAYEEETCGRTYDADKAFEHMMVAAEEGFSYAMFKVGCYHMYKTIEHAKNEEAVFWLNKAVDLGSGLAMLTLGDYYLYGYGEEREYEKAIEYYKKAEEVGYISEGIGVCYQFELGVEKDDTKAFNYYKIAADRNYSSGLFRLGMCYYYGTGTQQDRVEAFYYLKQVADQGNKDAAGYIGQMYLAGDGVEKNEVEGIQYLTEAAEAGYDDAQYHLGNCYLRGIGVEQNDELAMQWYQTAAENGNEDAQKIVGGPRKRRR
ncbi:MAG: sel1 repeat family protein [Flavobacteriaceae bacterium]|jgi:TPR repeat protein|nr:sel1 repeat family protein [Flavobacteriaceae bacterium]